MKETIVTIKMTADKPMMVYFNSPIMNPLYVQLIDYYIKFEGFSLYCDISHPQFSITNFPKTDSQNLNPSFLLAVFSDSKSYPKLPIQNKGELSNLTLTVTN